MKKILFSLFSIIAASSLIATGTYAVFTAQVKNTSNTFATGNASLQIKNETSQSWDSSYSGKSWSNIYPGWSDTYQVYLKNTSLAPISLRINPQLNIKNYSTGYLWDEVKMEISWADGSHSTGSQTLRTWTKADNNIFLDPVLSQNQEAGPWVVKFTVDPAAGNEIKDATLNFDLIFNGQQVL